MKKTWKLKRIAQCEKCPWRKDTNPHDIPNGYCVDKHKALESTIAPLANLTCAFDDELKVMACHETNDAHCVGWVHNQLGSGNNIALRLQMLSCDNINKLRLKGEQHDNFFDTLPEA